MLIDKLRVSGLIEYWLSKDYHDAAAAELAKVDWAKQPEEAVRIYQTPTWLLKARRRFMQIGSYYKQQLIRTVYRR